MRRKWGSHYCSSAMGLQFTRERDTVGLNTGAGKGTGKIVHVSVLAFMWWLRDVCCDYCSSYVLWPWFGACLWNSWWTFWNSHDFEARAQDHNCFCSVSIAESHMHSGNHINTTMLQLDGPLTSTYLQCFYSNVPLRTEPPLQASSAPSPNFYCHLSQSWDNALK